MTNIQYTLGSKWVQWFRSNDDYVKT